MAVNGEYCTEVIGHLTASGVSQVEWVLTGGGIAVSFVQSGEHVEALLGPDEGLSARDFVRTALSVPVAVVSEPEAVVEAAPVEAPIEPAPVEETV
jgi:hypothetical protein